MSFLIKISAEDHLKDVLKGESDASWHEGYLCALVDVGALTEEEYDELMLQVKR